jgi:Rad3-related DNA helicase
MAKIFSTEKLSLNGDNIRIQSTGAGVFEITNADSTSVLISRDSIETAHSSLNAQDVSEATSRSEKDSDLDGNVSSLNAQDVAEAATRSEKDSDLDGNVSSLNAQDVAETATRSEKDSDLDGNVSSLNAQDVAEAATRSEKDSDLDGNVSSLNAQDVAEAATRSEKDSDLDGNVSSLMAEITSTNSSIDSNDVVAVSQALGSGIDSKDVSFGRDFASVPTVSATMFNDQGEPIIGAMVSSITVSGCTIVFSDDLPSANYELKILASI